ncbi:MAG: ABC transporter ATP-binding protein [Coriobacteriaceae bacterium]|nr:ABC transporter ATP-binding protein [Coriobacteriaceae bacterium]
MDNQNQQVTPEEAVRCGAKAADASSDVILEATGLCKHFPVHNFFGRTKQVVRAVDGIDLAIRRGETFGLVGESGCGKSTLGRTLIRMYEPTSGKIVFDGHDITSAHGRELVDIHRKMQIIFQDPYMSLDPHMNVRQIIAEPMRVGSKLTDDEIDSRVAELLVNVGMRPDDMYKFAYEFSGGQRQRVGIARALSVHPEFILCDEPISALDVSIQAQVVNMLEDLQQQMGLTYLFVAHDLSMVRHISTRIGVMYLGRLVEVAPADELYENPLHPYTRALLSAAPIPDPKLARETRRIALEGELPSPLHVPSGCRFHTRCPQCSCEGCKQVEPALREVTPGHFVACDQVQ